MGFLKGGNILYLNVSCGYFVNKKKEIQEVGYTGYLKNIDKKTDEYEGKEITKIRILMQDEKSDEKVSIQFTEESWFSRSFFQRIQNVDLTKPFTVGVMQSDQNEKVSFCWMKQEGNKIEKADIPQPEEVSVGKNKVFNWEPFIAFIDTFIDDFQTNNKQESESISEEEEEMSF